jgi:3D-(3,5/4)-trihydroxycyclohexane-1,2-dione acylhydrolase (decyclizing)
MDPARASITIPMSKTVKLSVAAAMVRFLKVQYVSRDGVEHRLVQGVFGIFGHGNVTGLGQAIEEFGGRQLPFYQAKNEQAMVHSAIAFTKTRHRLGTFACTTSVGPGATNLVTGAATATINRLPVLLLPGDIFASRLPAPVLQQLECPASQDTSVNDCLRPVSKYWDRINRPEQIMASLPEAMRVLSDPAETGAVTISLPEDVQSESYEFPMQFFEKRVYSIERPACSAERLNDAVRLIKSSRRPLIIAGGGVKYSEACDAVARFASATGVPVSVTQAGMGAILHSHESWMGAVGVTGTSSANKLAREADLIIAIGTRLADFITASKTQFQNPKVRFIGLNINSADCRKDGALPLVGDARTILAQLSRALNGWRIPAAHDKAVKRERDAWERAKLRIISVRRGDGLTQAQAIAALNDACGADGIVVHAAGGIPGDIHKLWSSNGHNDYHSEYGYSCMGYEIAGALGAKIAEPEREVYAFMGDGSYLMLHTEIVTAVQEGIKLTIVVIDNHGYGCIQNLQVGCGGRSFGNAFRVKKGARLEGQVAQIDFVKNAESLGAKAVRAESLAEFRDALAMAKRNDGVIVIHVPVKSISTIPGFSWWNVPVSETSQIPSVRLARRAYDQAKRKQRFYY